MRPFSPPGTSAKGVAPAKARASLVTAQTTLLRHYITRNKVHHEVAAMVDRAIKSDPATGITRCKNKSGS
jgi:hypothetical protein